MRVSILFPLHTGLILWEPLLTTALLLSNIPCNNTQVWKKKLNTYLPKFGFTLDLNLIAVIWDVKLAINDKLQSIVSTLHWLFTLWIAMPIVCNIGERLFLVFSGVSIIFLILKWVMTDRILRCNLTKAYICTYKIVVAKIQHEGG